jgi:hypothetical protein
MKWLEKYMPTHWDDVTIHTDIKMEMDTWMSSLNSKKTDALFLYLCGASGTGKTTMARLFLQKYKYDIIEWNAIDLKQTKTIEEVFLKTLYKQNIQILVQEKNVLSGVILEECDCLQNVGKEIISKVTENIKNMEYRVPVICTSNELECDAIKNGKIIYFDRVPPKYIEELTYRICQNEKFHLSTCIVKFMLSKMDTDIRNWVIQLEYLYNFLKSKKKLDNIQLEDIYKYFDSVQIKNNDMTLYNWTSKVFESQTKWSDILHMTDNDSIIFPMMVYSNVNYNCKNKNFLESKLKLSQYYIMQEIFRENMKKCCFEELYGYSTLFSLGSVYVLKNIPSNGISCKSEITFPSNIYNKKYTECTHRKHINQIMYDYNITRIEINYWSFMLYLIYINLESDQIQQLIDFYIKMFNNNINNEEINEIFKCDYLRTDLKKRKKENILKTLYKTLNVDIKKNLEKKKRGRPKKKT